MKGNVRYIRRLIAKKRRGELKPIEELELIEWFDMVFGTPIRVLLFPVMLIVKLYKWTYEDREGLV